MKLNYSKRTFSTYLLLFSVLVLASSCVVYQNVPDDDGIYSSGERKNRVIIANNDDYKEYEENYFTKELESLEGIESDDVLTDIDNYSSVNDSITEVAVNYTPQAWGYGDNDDIVVNININNGYRWGGGFWDYYDPYFGFGYNNFWLSQRHYWGWFYNRPFFRPWGWGNYYGGYYAYGRGNRFNRYNRYYNNMNYGRRGTYSSRAVANTNSVFSRSRRTSTTSNARVSSVYRRGTSSSTRPTSRVRPTTTRGTTRTNSTRGNTNTRSRTSTRTRPTINRSSTRSRTSTNRSSTRTRSSSNRSSTRSSSRSSSSRSSSSRSSSSKKRG